MKIDLLSMIVVENGVMNKAATLSKVSDTLDELIAREEKDRNTIGPVVQAVYQEIKNIKPSMDLLASLALGKMDFPITEHAVMRAKVEAYIRGSFIVKQGKGGVIPR